MLALCTAAGQAGDQTSKGCSFFDEERAPPILAALQALRQRHRTPEGVYWFYLEDRARALSLPCATPEERALVRLCLLARRDAALALAWRELAWSDRTILTEGLTAPLPVALCGLPGFFGAVDRNTACGGAKVALLVLSDILAKLQAFVPAAGIVRPLDLSDIVNFAAEVSVAASFELVVESARVEVTSTGVSLQVAPRAWQRVKEGPDLEDRAPGLARSLRRLLAKQEALERGRPGR